MSNKYDIIARAAIKRLLKDNSEITRDRLPSLDEMLAGGAFSCPDLVLEQRLEDARDIAAEMKKAREADDNE